MTMNMTKIEFDPVALSGLLPKELDLYVHLLDTAYIELLSDDSIPSTANVTALADAVVALYDEIARCENGV